MALSAIPGFGGQNAAMLNMQKLQAGSPAKADMARELQKMGLGTEGIRAPQTNADLGSVVDTGNNKAQPSFATMLNDLVDSVDAKSKVAQQQAQDVMLGKSDNLHQAMISMQEASVSFSLLVEVRNKLVDSYKELSRMQV